jgi:Fe-S oxidoreductase/nitrate reductase gamma subunit
LDATREVFGNIAPWMRALFYLLAAASLVAGLWPAWQRCRVWRRGRAGEYEADGRVWLRRLFVYGLGQRRVMKRSLGGLLHLLLFSGFLVLTLGTTLLFVAHSGPVDFHRGTYYLAYELVMDVFGVAFLAGCLLALYRRGCRRPASLGHAASDYWLLGLLLAIGATGFLLEALRLRWAAVPASIAHWSPVGDALAAAAAPALSPAAARAAHRWTWWLHVALILAFFVAWSRTRFLHVLTGALNLMLRPSRHAGALATVPMAEVEETGRIGVETPADLTRAQLLSLDACMECGRCQDACPAFATRKPLSPERLVQDLRRAAQALRATTAASASLAAPGGEPVPATLPTDQPLPTLPGGVIQPETLWACTMCQACVFECPVLIGQVDLIAGMRRALVGAGQLAGPPAQALRRLAGQGNPYGQPARERLAWAAGLGLPTAAEAPDFEVLLWVGCAASFDPRAQKVARATALLLRHAGVRFAVMESERCTGDPARRLGDEFLFQQLAEQNVAALQAGRVRRIVTPCPHCMNTLRHEYPEFGGTFEVVHHTRFLADLVEAGRLPRAAEQPETGRVTLHDPCYLARVNGETEATRTLAAAAGADLVEMPRHGRRTFCCGAGGGRIYFEETPEQRVSRQRAAEAVATGAGTLLTACPFCLNMMSDGMAGTTGGENVPVVDIAELLLAAIEPEGTATTTPATSPPEVSR